MHLGPVGRDLAAYANFVLGQLDVQTHTAPRQVWGHHRSDVSCNVVVCVVIPRPEVISVMAFTAGP